MTESYKESAKEENFGLPEMANEAGPFLQELWLDREENREPGKSLDEMTETEREEFRKEYFARQEIEPKFDWLAQIFRSEMAWSQNTIETNYGRIFCFKFGYGEEDRGQPPSVFVFYPNSHDYRDGIILLEKQDGWSKQNLQEFQQEYFKEGYGY